MARRRAPQVNVIQSQSVEQRFEFRLNGTDQMKIGTAIQAGEGVDQAGHAFP